jgi:hypothetical protein
MDKALNYSPIGWKSATVKLKDLKDYPQNPRKMGKDEFNSLVKSLKEDGYHQRLLVNTDGTIIGGHSRKKALLKAGYTLEDDIEVLIPTTKLTSEEFDRVNIRDNLEFGGWDSDILGNRFDAQQLIEWGMPEFLLLGEKPEEEERKPIEKKTKLCPSCGEILN